MSTRDELYPSKWFKASDIPEMGLPVQIEHVTRKKIGAEQKDKPVVGFKGHEKELVLNVTNFDCIANALSEDVPKNGWVVSSNFMPLKQVSAAR